MFTLRCFKLAAALCADMPPEKMLPFAAQVVSKPNWSIIRYYMQWLLHGHFFEFRVPSLGTQLFDMVYFDSYQAACGCRALGARSGLPHYSDPRIASFLHQSSENAVLVPWVSTTWLHGLISIHNGVPYIPYAKIIFDFLLYFSETVMSWEIILMTYAYVLISAY